MQDRIGIQWFMKQQSLAQAKHDIKKLQAKLVLHYGYLIFADLLSAAAERCTSAQFEPG